MFLIHLSKMWLKPVIYCYFNPSVKTDGNNNFLFINYFCSVFFSSLPLAEANGTVLFNDSWL